eukprot:1240152-Prymnesium_polylepis.1
MRKVLIVVCRIRSGADSVRIFLDGCILVRVLISISVPQVSSIRLGVGERGPVGADVSEITGADSLMLKDNPDLVRRITRCNGGLWGIRGT